MRSDWLIEGLHFQISRRKNISPWSQGRKTPPERKSTPYSPYNKGMAMVHDSEKSISHKKNIETEQKKTVVIIR